MGSDLNDRLAALVADATDNVPSAFPDYSITSPSAKDLAAYIDHTLLKLDATPDQIDKLCDEAIASKFKSVCIRPSYVPRCASKLRDSSVLVCTVIGFHEGTQPTDEKVAEAKQCTADGAHELDMVLNYPLLLSTPPEYAGCYADVRAVRDAAPAPTVLKAILETSQLSVAQIVAASVIAVEAGVDFVKTSTGFRGGGATEEHVRVMRWVAERHGQGRVGVKASGGVRTLADAEGMIRAGASRIGTSGGVGIVRQAEERAGAEGGGVRGS